jgi:elongation factor 2
MVYLEKINELMYTHENIRNIALVAHIDHGKTTLSDSLLASAGILAPSTAGEARALDFLPEEQRRGITMKTANISLILKKSKTDYLVNLIDSPGHVDFSGKVARALRIADGAIVIVDAVEQIMAQTETVTRQCLQEGVKPVLFINKVDRLINELRFSPQEVAERIEIIYNNFNSLIEMNLKSINLPNWSVNPKNGSVVFGSALHRWALSLPIAKKLGITFENIFEAYKQGNLEFLQQKLSIDYPLIELITSHLPNPKEAQQYKIKNIWQGDLQSKIGKSMTSCSTKSSDPVVIATSKVLFDKHVGTLTLGRIFSGKLTPRKKLILLSKNKQQQIQNLYLFMGQEKKRIDEIPAGNIVAISGLENIHPGETLVDKKASTIPPFEEIKYIANPVVTVAIEPRMLRDLTELKKVLEMYDLEDPNLHVIQDEQSGEILLMGLGELHLETVVNEISKKIECTASSPIVVIVERISKSSKFQTDDLYGTSITLKVEPYLRENQQVEGNNSTSETVEGEKAIDYRSFSLTEYKNECLIAREILNAREEETIDNILLGVKEALNNGPIARKPVSSVRVIINDFNTTSEEKYEYTVPLTRNTIWKALKKANITTQEPIYRIQITIPQKYLGKISSIIKKRRGTINDVRSDQDMLIITGLIPVAETFSIAHKFRSATEGRAFWQMSFEKYQEVNI